MSKKIGIIHYDIGNLMSVEQAFSHLKADYKFVRTPEEIESCEKLVLPGVGAFTGCVNELKKRHLWEAIATQVKKEIPLFGICVGMQMLFDGSEEFGNSEGFGFIPGMVKAIPNKTTAGESQKIPHIAWTGLQKPKETNWKNTFLENVPENSDVYFVHSYTGHPSDESHRLADAHYGGHRLSACVRKEHIFGTQFHPEKSGEVGLKVIDAFIKL